MTRARALGLGIGERRRSDDDDDDDDDARESRTRETSDARDGGTLCARRAEVRRRGDAATRRGVTTRASIHRTSTEVQ